MSDPNTLRILEIDGGGERGYLSVKFLQRFIQLWGVDPASLAKQFDVICGTSVGGMMALGLAFGLTPQQMSDFLTVQGPYIFSLTSLSPSVRPNSLTKVALLLAGTPFYQSSGPTENDYGYGLLSTTLSNLFGSNTLQNLQTNVIIPSYKFDTKNYVLCSNLDYPDFVGQNELISNICLATGSAPYYFPPLILSNSIPGTLSGTYIDGGIYQNNPSSFGLTLGKMLKPNASRYCVLSIGTGLGEMGFDPGNPDIVDVRVAHIAKALLASGVSLRDDPGSIAGLFSLFDIACTGGQESVAKALMLEALYTLDQLYFYRFQPTLDPNVNTELDNTDPEILNYYDQTAIDVFNSDIENIANFLGHLTA